MKDAHITDDVANDESYTDLIAIEMAETFEMNSRSYMGNTYLSMEGMDELADIFEEVPIALRAIVYGKFLQELENRGVKFDREMFQRAN